MKPSLLVLLLFTLIGSTSFQSADEGFDDRKSEIDILLKDIHAQCYYKHPTSLLLLQMKVNYYGDVAIQDILEVSVEGGYSNSLLHTELHFCINNQIEANRNTFKVQKPPLPSAKSKSDPCFETFYSLRLFGKRKSN